VARESISRFTGCLAVVLLLLQIANGLPVCGFRGLEQVHLPHPPRVRLRLTVEGKPLPGANVELYFGKPSPKNDLPYETGITDSGGVAITSELPAATFYIRVQSSDHQIAEFTLDAPLEKELNTGAGTLELSATPLVPVVPVEDSEPCCAACSVVVDKTLQAELRALRGVVVDPMGAVITTGIIDVYQNEESKRVIARLKTDGTGRFDSELAPGKYLVIFKACGFDTQRVAITVATDGWRGMQLALAPGYICGKRLGNEASIKELNWESSENR